MMNRIIVMIIPVVLIVVSQARVQTLDEIIENIYQQTIIDEARLDSLGDYSYIQEIHFTKLDGDGEIEEQSRREFLVSVRSQEIRHRKLMVALDFEDEEWVDVTEKEKNKKRRAESTSEKFSLTEIVSPEMRDNYNFQLVGNEIIDGYDSIYLKVQPLEEDEEKFAGDLWFEKNTYALIQAKLVPSELPTGVQDMIMEFSMRKFGELWLPVKIIFEAEVSFLIIFKGKVLSEILFEDYLFDQSFPDSLFGF